MFSIQQIDKLSNLGEISLFNYKMEEKIEVEHNEELALPIPNILDLQMFANPEDEGRTEEPTEYKKRKSREEGRVAKSQELVSGLLLIGFFGVFLLFGRFIENRIKDLFYDVFNNIGYFDLTIESFPILMSYTLGEILIICAPVLAAGVVFSILGNLFQVGFLFTTKPLEPKADKIKPKFQKIFLSRTTVFNLVKSVFKVLLVGVMLYFFIRFFTGELLALGTLDTPISWSRAKFISLIILGSISIFLSVLSIADVFYQRWDYKENLKMSRYELKEERKDTEGDPYVKQRIRDRFREISSRKTAEAIPKADVVITNPTHYAVAIKYDENLSDAPLVTAKGEGFMALKIKEIAKEHDVPLVENKPLARALYSQVEVGDEVPEDFYVAVAEVLAYVYRLKRKFPNF